MVKIYAYSMASVSARNLAEELDCSLIRHRNSRYIPRRGHTVVNWGAGRDFTPARTLNHPDAVSRSVNKLTALRTMSDAGVRTVPFTVDKAVAQQWQHQGHVVVSRRLLSASEGKGIIITQPGFRLPNVPLYTRYVKKQGEYRVHVFQGRVIDRQKKVLPAAHQGERNFYVRNTANGFIFIRNGINVPADVEAQAIAAVRALGLDFGAVDVIYGGRSAFVLEVNTAPGIEGTTVRLYAEAIRGVQ